MNYLVLIGSGVIIGLILAAPVGPVNLICIRRALQFGPLNGFVSGLGAAMGDGVFAAVSAFGFTVVAQLIEGFSNSLEVAGGVLLLIFGLHTYLTQPPASKDVQLPPREREKNPGSLPRAMVSTFALTITNPATLFGVAALFAGLGGLAGAGTSYLEAAVVVGGVIGGSVLWWFTLTSIIGIFHARIDARIMRIINHASGLAVSAFGAAVLVHVALKFL